ncbi:putative membrane protein [Desulfosoma caldarium]|uniref:Putative membrane protein n=1 Tax=Desulfosoma caldarium TaxID=610254 RepID=A0A3N1UJ99_9BACT|nr:putative membrane protein [Desulfosoma caldarium]
MALSVLTALAAASVDAWTKKFFGHRDAVTMAFYPLGYSLPLFLATWPFVPVPTLDATFWWCFGLSVPINCLSFVLYMEAIRLSPLSLTVPLLTLTPAFMVITGYAFLQEAASWPAVLGIAIIVCGGYLLNAPSAQEGMLEPLRSLAREKGSLAMVAVAFIYSFSAVLGKKAILHSSPMFFGVFFFVLQNFLLVIWAILTGQADARLFMTLSNASKGLLVGSLYYLHVMLHVWAISMTQAAYMISLKRLSAVFGVLYGAWLFREKHVGWRLVGSAIMVAGAALVAVGG